MRIVIINPLSHDPVVKEWGRTVSAGLEPLVGKKITHCTVYPSLSEDAGDYKDSLNYVSELLIDLSSIPPEDEVTYMMFAVDQEGFQTVSLTTQALQIKDFLPQKTILYTNQQIQRVPQGTFLMIPRSLANNYQQEIMMGQATVSVPPVPPANILNTENKNQAFYIDLDIPSLDLIYPIALWTKDLSVPVVVHVSDKMDDNTKEYIGSIPNISLSTAETCFMAGEKDIYFSDRYCITRAMQAGAHALIPLHAKHLFDLVEMKPQHIMVSMDKKKVAQSVKAPRNCSFMVDDNMFLQKITEIFVPPQNENTEGSNLTGFGGL